MNDNTTNSCCFYGPLKLDGYHLTKLIPALKMRILRLAERGVTEFYAGFLPGFDILAAQMVLDLRDSGVKIKLHVPVPEHGYTIQSMTGGDMLYESMNFQPDSTRGIQYNGNFCYNGHRQIARHCFYAIILSESYWSNDGATQIYVKSNKRIIFVDHF